LSACASSGPRRCGSLASRSPCRSPSAGVLLPGLGVQPARSAPAATSPPRTRTRTSCRQGALPADEGGSERERRDDEACRGQAHHRCRLADAAGNRVKWSARRELSCSQRAPQRPTRRTDATRSGSNVVRGQPPDPRHDAGRPARRDAAGCATAAAAGSAAAKSRSTTWAEVTGACSRPACSAASMGD
jgi:hypothetical protein